MSLCLLSLHNLFLGCGLRNTSTTQYVWQTSSYQGWDVNHLVPPCCGWWRVWLALQAHNLQHDLILSENDTQWDHPQTWNQGSGSQTSGLYQRRQKVTSCSAKEIGKTGDIIKMHELLEIRAHDWKALWGGGGSAGKALISKNAQAWYELSY